MEDIGAGRVSTERLSYRKKEASGKQWYKDWADYLDGMSRGGVVAEDRNRMRINYDLFNNKLDTKDLEYVVRPFGDGVGELPARMVNRDIVSGKIKALLGMERRLPFIWKATATNQEAISRKANAEFERLREAVKLTFERGVKGQEGGSDGQEVQAQKGQGQEEDLLAEVKRYMEREYQDPAEVLANKLLAYLHRKLNLEMVFNDGFKHLALSSMEVYYVGIANREPVVWNVNSMNFRCGTIGAGQFIEDSEWCVCEYYWTPSKVIEMFNGELTDRQIDRINDDSHKGFHIRNIPFSQTDEDIGTDDTTGKIRVIHCCWRGLRKVRFVKTEVDGIVSEKVILDEEFKSRGADGVKVETRWIPEVYETWKIGTDIYVQMQPIPGQFKDLENLYSCKLPYYGVVSDNMNSTPVSIMDRIKPYQYFYNIVMYRIEMLMAADKGKKVLLNVSSVPDSAGIDIEKFMYMTEASPIMFFDASEEGSTYNDVNQIAKTIDLSTSADIYKYVEFANYLRQQAGACIGVTERMEGEVGNRETTANYSQSLQQSSNILEPYFSMHAIVKKNLLTALIETAKVAYSEYKPKKLGYMLDEMSYQMLDLDVGLLDASTYSIFITDSYKTEELRQTINQLAHAAMQNQMVQFSDVVSILRQDSVAEAEAYLKSKEKEAMEKAQQGQQQQQEFEQKKMEEERKFEMEKMKFELQGKIQLEEMRRKTEVVKASLMASSFNPNQDADNDGVNDFIELARGMDKEVQIEKIRSNESLMQQQLETEREVAMINAEAKVEAAKVAAEGQVRGKEADRESEREKSESKERIERFKKDKNK